MLDERIPPGLTFDDVLVVPAHSEVLPSEVGTQTAFTRKISLNLPLVSAAMDTVTEAQMAIAIAQQGGLGVVHKNMSIEAQRNEVDKVKRSESGMIVDPVTVKPAEKIRRVHELMKEFHISGVPVVDDAGKLVGILTNRDLRFETRTDVEVRELMTKDNLVTVPVGTGMEEAKKLLHKHRIEKLLVVDEGYRLKGLITFKDIQKRIKYPNASKDEMGRLRVGAALGASPDTLERAHELLRAGADVLVVDSAHGHSKGVLETSKRVRAKFPDALLVAGNVVTQEGAKALIDCGVDAVKVGVGPGSICTTRIVAGVGVPQLTAIASVRRETAKAKVPLIADGGVRYSGDILKALVAGADTVMMGSLFAGMDESPGETVIYQGRTYKTYRGMGSVAAMKEGGAERYFQRYDAFEEETLIAQGIEGRIPYKGSLAAIVHQLMGGLRAGMGYAGCASVEELQAKARFVRMTQAGMRESHPHDVTITKDAPNYRGE